jgi:Asp-tRNA(Asn)/Glu-tRNA(Gln) amidotransferase A subunit family amidase
VQDRSRFAAWIEEQGHGIEVRRFPQGTRTAEDAARAIGCEVGQIVKSLVFTAAGQPVVALPAPASGLPVGIQVVGRSNAETLAIAAWLEREWRRQA